MPGPLSESEGGAKKREVLECLKKISTVTSYLTQPQSLTEGATVSSAPAEGNKVS